MTWLGMTLVAVLNSVTSFLQTDALLTAVYFVNSSMWLIGSIIVSTLEKCRESK